MIHVGMATIPSRKKEMLETVDSLYNQVDRFYIYLNNYSHIPEELNREKITVFTSQQTGDKRAKGKFFNVDNLEGYYFSVDDDIIYPTNYIESTIKKIEDYNRKCIVCYHGSVAPNKPVSIYYQERVRYKFSHKQVKDVPIHIPGTGVMAFHTNTLKLKFEDLFREKYLDISFGLICQEKKIPVICLQREKNWILSSPTVDHNKSLYAQYEQNQQQMAELVNKGMPWKLLI